MPQLNPITGLNAAVAAVQSGDLGRARRLCEDVLDRDPQHAEALRLAGVIECFGGQYGRGVDLLQRSISADPGQALAYANLAGGLVMLRRHEQAVAQADRALLLQPSLTEALYCRGCAQLELGRLEAALEDFDGALAGNPRLFPALLNRGNVLQQLGRLAEALASLDRAIGENPRDPTAHYNRGNVLRDLGRPEAALESYDRALGMRLEIAELFNNRGNALRDLGRREEALAAYARALQLSPEAIEPLNNRGMVLLDLGHAREALHCFDDVLRVQPDFAVALDNRGLALRMDGRPEEAAAAYAELQRVAPDYKAVASNLHFARLLCCDWLHYAQSEAAVLDAARRDRPVSPFALLAVSSSVELQRRSAGVFAAAEGWTAQERPMWTGARYAHERLRIAYVSADLRPHALSFLLVGALEQHDRGRFEVLGYALQAPDASPFGRRVTSAFDRFVDVSRTSDRDIAQMLRAAEVDIAVDLMGYTRSCRPRVFAHRPAPVQVNFLGYPAGMGVPFMDYLIADQVVIPPGTADKYAERVVYLPECFQPNDDRREIGPQPSRAEAGLPQHGFVFCSFNNSYKFTPVMFDVWMRLLRAVPASVLWLAPDNPAVPRNLRREAAARDVDPERLVVSPRLPYAQHLGRLSLADLFLDTLPFNAGTTASDALWAGVPVVTVSGEAFASRMAASLLTAIGVPELITTSLGDYERLALDLATHPERLAQLRARVQANLSTAPLFDTARYCRHLEAAYEAMHAAVQPAA